jgi:hypothetical protein
MEQMPEGTNEYFENDMAMLTWDAYMNIYMYAEDDGTWGKNGENEFGGYPSDSSLYNQWGFHWDGVLAMCVTRFWCECCEITESDIVFNPDYSWTFDRDVAAQDPTKIFYPSVLLHELGHSWGMQRPSSIEDYAYEHPTVMHAYVSSEIQDYRTIHWPEAYLMRRTYDDQTSIPTMSNMVVVSKYAHPTDLTWRSSTTFPDSVVFAGDDLDVFNLTVENTGTENLSNVHVRFYLEPVAGGPQWLIGDWVWATYPAETYGVYDFLDMQVPFSIPTGTYRVVAKSTINGYEGDDLGFDSTTDFFDTIEVHGRSIEVTSPVLFDEWYVGDTHNITWDSENAGSQVKIRFSRDGGATWHLIAASAPNTGTFSWIVEGPPDTSVWVEVSSVTHGLEVSDTSESFRILGRSLQVTQPNGGENLTVGSNYDIRWNSFDSGDEVSLSYRCAPSSVWQPITPAPVTDVGFYAWVLPNVSSTQCLVKVESATYSGVEDTSDGYFTLTNASVDVLSPGDGDVWFTNELAKIDFSYGGGCSVVGFDLSRDGGTSWTSLGTTFSDQSPFAWLITGPDTSQARIRVYDACNTDAFGLSPIFEIATRSIEVSAPNGGEVWASGETYSITWNEVGAGDTVSIGFSRDEGVSDFHWIALNVPNTGAYSWVVPPELEGSTARVSITGSSVGGLRDWSDADFTVLVPSIQVMSPNGGETLIGGESTSIKWKSTNAGGAVRIDYFLPRSKIPRAVTSSTSNDGLFSWIVPESLVGSQAVIRVKALEYPATFDGSDAFFSIERRSLQVTAPTGGELFAPGGSNTMTISWTSENAGDYVQLTESCDEGQTWDLIAFSIVNDGHWETPVEPPRRTGCRVRVASRSFSELYDLSEGTYGVANSGPVAVDDDRLVHSARANVISVLDNDYDADGDLLSVVSVSAASGGTVSHDGSSVTYTPNPGFTGDDSFRYDVVDGYGGSVSATVRVQVSLFSDGFESGDTTRWNRP